MKYSKFALGLAAGLLLTGAADAVMPAPCTDAGDAACAAARKELATYPEWALVVYPEASHVVYPEGILVFRDR
jgi:hypothetical protein